MKLKGRYVESQGAFAQRVAAAMQSRLQKECGLELAKQVVFDEPRIRVNFDKPYMETIAWDESGAWDAMAEFYLNAHGK